MEAGTKMEIFFKKEKKMQCSNTYRISHFLYRNTYRIAIILYRDNPTYVFFFNVKKKKMSAETRKRVRKMAITQVILVLKVNVAQKKTHCVT